MRRVFVGLMVVSALVLTGCSGSGDITNVNEVTPEMEEAYLLDYSQAMLASFENKRDPQEFVKTISPSDRAEVIGSAVELCERLQGNDVDDVVFRFDLATAIALDRKEPNIQPDLHMLSVEHFCPSQKEKVTEAIREAAR